MSQPDREDGRVLRARALREERRIQILQAARQVFAQKGYHSATITDIIGAAKVARGTFYLYFESKRSIFEEILDGLLIQLRGAIRPVLLDIDSSPEEQLAQTLARILTILVENEDLTEILLKQAVGLDRDFDKKLNEFYGQALLMIQSSLQIGMEIGLVRQVDSRIVSSCILGSVKEVLSVALFSQDDDRPELLAVAKEILTYNLHGVLIS